MWAAVWLTLLAAEPSPPSLQSGLAVQGDLLVPLNRGYGGNRDLGFGGAISYWFQWPNAVFAPQAALHYGPGAQGEQFIQVSGALGVMILPLEGPVTPLIGGHAGLRFLSVRGVTDAKEVGSVLRTQVEVTPSVTTFGPAVSGRLGVLLFRGSPVELTVLGEYSAIFVDGTPQALTFSLGLST